jgi:hypothetical protein
MIENGRLVASFLCYDRVPQGQSEILISGFKVRLATG